VLADLPLLFILVGLAAYAVLAGADFGAGIWVLFSRAADKGLRDHARHAMGPVWEANHVWLIFVIVVCWTAYPVAFGSIGSTLCVPLFIAAIGIILRGTAYALRASAETPREENVLDRVLGLSSILTPFALGAAAGGIASGRVPVGNAAGDLVTSWLNPTSIAIGVLSVATGAYLAAVYLAADAQRLREADLVRAFRTRALAAGVVTGALALGALLVVRSDAPRIWDGLTSGWGILALVASAAGGFATVALVWRERFEPARAAATIAVVAIIAGWAIAQSPDLLPGLTVHEAASGHATLVALVIAVAFGAVVLLPSLGYLFTLVLRGRLDPGETERAAPTGAPAAPATEGRLVFAGACFAVGVVLTVLVDPGWGRIVGVTALLAGAVTAFGVLAIAPSADDRGGG
jgi:cytochrome d ubiquinol oxidase subunit II